MLETLGEFVNTATLSKSFTCRRSREAVGAKVASMTFHPLVHIMYLTFRCHKLSSKVGQAAPASKSKASESCWHVAA